MSAAPPAAAGRGRGAEGRWRWSDGPAYGALGLPLAFVALPLYVLLPSHYAERYGVPLATLGALLLATRLFDAFIDPWLGAFVDRWFARSRAALLALAAAAAVVLALGLRGLFFPWPAGGTALLAWCGALLLVTYVGYSVLSVLHQAWGARLGGDAATRARIVSWREGAALAGVLIASVLPAWLGLATAGAVFALLLAVAVAVLAWAPLQAAAPGIPETPETPETRMSSPASPASTPSGARCAAATPPPSPASPLQAAPAPASAADATAADPLWLPLATAPFRRLLAVYLLNGIAGAVPATLVLFFVRDRLQAPAQEPLFLAAYFAAAALSLPLWLRAVRPLGLGRAWLAGMVLAIATFAWALTLGAGDTTGFALVCLASGAALGADLALPGALLAGVIHRAGHGRRREGLYFGWWNFATKLNLALAAGAALPLLGLAGYVPGSRDAAALQALTLTYALLPCLLKAAAALLLWTLLQRPGREWE